jgi:hypothetical protein
LPIANSRLIALDQQGVTFKWKDYRIAGRDRHKRMTLATDEFSPCRSEPILAGRGASLFGNACQPIDIAEPYFDRFFQKRLEIVE